MIERIYILESVDPVIFYGVNNSNMQLIKTLFPKLRIVARGNVMKVIGDEDESELFLKKIREVEKYCEEFNSLSEDVILDIIKGKGPTVVKQENLIIHGMNGKPITARTENQQLLVKAFENNDLVFATGPAGSGKTFVAIALAVKALKNKEVRKIILSRPAVEAGEKLGFLPGEMKDKLDKVNSSKKKNNTAKKLFYLMLAMELYRKTPKKASLSFILVESYLISKVLENTYSDNTDYQSICEDFQKEILKGIDDIDSFIKKIDTNFDTISRMKKELTSKYKDYLDTNPFKDLFMDLDNVTTLLDSRRKELVDIHKSLDDSYKLSEEKIKILSYS